MEAGYAGMHLSDWVYLYATEESLEYGRGWDDWMIGISFLSKEQIGIGDGIVTGLLGCLLGARGCLVMLCIASCLMAVISIGILILKKGSRRTTLPFVPALLGGYIAALAVLG